MSPRGSPRVRSCRGELSLGCRNRRIGESRDDSVCAGFRGAAGLGPTPHGTRLGYRWRRSFGIGGPGNSLHAFHELRKPRPAKEDFAVAAVQDSGKERFLEGKERQHPLLDRSLGHEIDDIDTVRLPQAVHPTDALLEHGGIPGQIHVDDRGGGMLEIQAYAAGIRRQEHPAARILAEAVDQSTPLRARHLLAPITTATARSTTFPRMRN